MEFTLDQQVLRPITNEVEVLNGQAFRDVVLRPRIESLLTAPTAGELLKRIETCERSLAALGTNPKFTLVKSRESLAENVLQLRTVVDLRETRPDHRLMLTSAVDDERYRLNAMWQVYNQLKLGERVEISATVQPSPQKLAAGQAAFVTPLMLGRSLLTLKGFFFNEDRAWASHALASHGVDANLQIPLGAHAQIRGGARAIMRHLHSVTDSAGDAVRAVAGQSSLKVSALLEFLHAKTHASGASHAVSARCEVAGHPGDTQHLKSVVDADLRLPLRANNALELAAHLRGGYILPNAGKLRIGDHFYVGGPDSVLGFAHNSVGPRDAGDFVGGEAFYTSRLALLAKMPFQARSPLRIKAQVDAGVLRAHAAKNWASNVQSLLNKPATVSSAVGVVYRNERAQFDVMYVVPLVAGAGGVPRGGLHVSAELSLM